MKNFVQQIAKLWGQLGINQRVTMAVAIVGVIAGMAALVVWSGRPQMQLLYGRLSDKEISEVVAAVQEQSVKYELGSGGTSVYVPGDQVHKLRMHLASKGIPSGDGIGFEIFDRTNFGISDFVQRTNYLRALQGELGRTISQLKGVRSARVMIVMPENRLLFSDTKAKPTASVFIDQGFGALNQEAVNSIRFLVANSVEGLNPNDVAVVDSHGAVLTENLKDDPTLGAASSQMKYRKSVEDYFSGKVETMLAKVLGPGNAVVRVSAEIDANSSTTVEEKYDPEGQVIRTETSTEDTTNTKETEGTGPVGVAANIPNNSPDQAKANGKNSEQVRKNKTNSYEINRTTTNSVKNPGGIARVSAAVFVAAKAQPRTPQELESLRKMVVNALGIKTQTAQELDRSVSLEEVAFEAQPAAAKPAVTDMLYNNQDLVRSVVALLVAGAVILIFLRLLKRVKPDEIPLEILDANGLALSEGSSGNADISPEMLNDLIRQKPANVGAALRGWMAAPAEKS